MNRRNLMVFLGLAPLGTAAMSTEDAGTDLGDGKTQKIPQIAMRSPETHQKIITALERLVTGLRNGDVGMVEFETNSKFTSDEWLKHEVILRFELLA